MGLISVDRKPTILGTVTDYVTPLFTTAAIPAVWDFRASNQFKDVTGTLLVAGLRIYGVTVVNESGVDLQVAFDSSLGSDNPAYFTGVGTLLPAFSTRYFDVSTLLGVDGAHRVLLASTYVSTGGSVPTSNIGRYQTARYTLTATFYTAQQSA